MRKFILALLVFFSILVPVKALAVTFDLSFTLFNQLGEKKEPIANVETVFSGATQKTDDSGTVTFKNVNLPVGQQRATLTITVGGKTYSAESAPFLVEKNTTRIGQPITFTNIPKEALQPGSIGTSGTISYTSPDLSLIFKDKKYQTLGDYLTDLVKVAMVLSVVGATLVVVYAGFGYLNSGGSPEGTAHSKEMIAGALIGIATVFMMSVFLVSLYDKETLKNLSPPINSENSTNPLSTTQRTALVAHGKTDAQSTLEKALELGNITIEGLKNYDCSKLFREVSGDAKEQAIDKAFNQGILEGCNAFKKSKAP